VSLFIQLATVACGKPLETDFRHSFCVAVKWNGLHNVYCSNKRHRDDAGCRQKRFTTIDEIAARFPVNLAIEATLTASDVTDKRNDWLTFGTSNGTSLL